eukprot:TRINITY_DN26889_c0_g1_i1.p1 TRINITY_DN26889_c0_g1~~TRINITY_DN26889_c0_g1_i1.p1  ORF type:complete len:137 (-),score=36.19 TRINITY_DN26889_c0_g1_i1:82-492(-)
MGSTSKTTSSFRSSTMDQNSEEATNLCDHTSKTKDDIMASQNSVLEERNKVEKHEIESLIDAVWSLSTDDVDVKSEQNERTTLHDIHTWNSDETHDDTTIHSDSLVLKENETTLALSSPKNVSQTRRRRRRNKKRY